MTKASRQPVVTAGRVLDAGKEVYLQCSGPLYSFHPWQMGSFHFESLFIRFNTHKLIAAHNTLNVFYCYNVARPQIFSLHTIFNTSCNCSFATTAARSHNLAFISQKKSWHISFSGPTSMISHLILPRESKIKFTFGYKETNCNQNCRWTNCPESYFLSRDSLFVNTVNTCSSQLCFHWNFLISDRTRKTSCRLVVSHKWNLLCFLYTNKVLK